MKFPIRIHRRWLRRVALGLTVAAVVAPAAQAYPVGAGLDTASLPCTPSCSFESGASTALQQAERAHPRGGLMVGAASVSEELAGRRFGSTVIGPQTTTPAFSHFSRGPGQIIAGPAVDSTGGTNVDGRAVGAGVGIGAAFALALAGLAALLGRQRNGLAHA